VILLDWILIGALDGARLALEVEPLILFVEWSRFETVELLELQTIPHSKQAVSLPPLKHVAF